MPGPGEEREAERRIESTEREAGRGGGRNDMKGDGNEEGLRKIREGAKWKMEQDGREQQGRMMCAVNVESWQGG